MVNATPIITVAHQWSTRCSLSSNRWILKRTHLLNIRLHVTTKWSNISVCTIIIISLISAKTLRRKNKGEQRAQANSYNGNTRPLPTVPTPSNRTAGPPPTPPGQPCGLPRTAPPPPPLRNGPPAPPPR